MGNVRRCSTQAVRARTPSCVTNRTGEPTVLAVAGSLGVTPSPVGLAWLLHHAPDVLLISRACAVVTGSPTEEPGGHLY
jgi:hypothetical protein